MIDRPAYRYYVLAVMTLVQLFSVADRLAMSILLQDIKTDLHLSDTQMGLLAGLAFTLFYVTLGFPLGRLADRHKRTGLIALALAFWSLMTALCGMATGFLSLFILRAGVGAGEAGSGPAGQSLLTDYFRPGELARALGFYMLGATLGTVGGLMGGGLLASQFGWRMTFALLGLPGLVLAAILYLTVREPPRGRFSKAPRAPTEPPEGLATTLRSLASNRVFVGITLAYAVQIMIGYAIAIWMAPIMLRRFQVSIGEVGLYLGLAFALGGIPGPVAGGFLTDWLVRFDARWRAWLPGLAGLACLPFLALALHAMGIEGFLGFLALGYGIFVASQAPILSLIHINVVAHQRALAIACVLFFNNVIGQALSAAAIGRLSDHWSTAAGGGGLSLAVLVVCGGAALGGMALFLWTARQMQARPASA